MTEYAPLPSNYREGKLPLPTGSDDWADMARRYYLVDKTLLIKELWDNAPHVALFTRPRRFGKSTALQMLKTFFEMAEESNAPLFEDKLIWKAGEAYRGLQGKFPVIHLTFKDHKGTTWDEALYMLNSTVGRELARHRCIFNGQWEIPADREKMQRVFDQKAAPPELAEALGILAEALHRHHGIKPVILIDEYDSPINSASAHGYYDKMVNFMRIFLSSALKSCQHCQMGVLTGVLRVAKEGIFSGLNNLDVYSVFDMDYCQYFGFTEAEVEQMAAYYGVPERMEEIRQWYDGYSFGGTELYNPWSVTKYFQGRCVPQPYWLNTSSNDIIAEIIQTMPYQIWHTLKALMEGNSVSVSMAPELGPYTQMRQSEESLYALLVSTGYLRTESGIVNGRCAVRIPNREVATAYSQEIMHRLNHVCRESRTLDAIWDALFRRDADAFRKMLSVFLKESVSYLDGAAEGFFHGLVLGFLAMMRDTYRVTSNAESGDGRYDIQLRPLLPGFPGVILEIKAADSAKDDLEQLALTARKQIDAKGYAASMQAEGVQDILSYGLAFYKKDVALVEEEAMR